MPFLERDLPATTPRPLDFEYVCQVTRLVQERTRLLSELGETCSFFFSEDLSYPASQLIIKGLDATSARTVLERVISAVGDAPLWRVAQLEESIRPLGEEPGMSTKLVFGVVRVAITGRSAAPPLFETMEVLGPERCLRRLRAALALLASLPQEQAH